MNIISWIQDASPIDIIYSESMFSFSVFLLLFFSSVIGRRMSKNLIFVVVFLWLITISQRPETYNTDTLHYSSYYLAVDEVGIVDMFLIKLEPLHYLMAYISTSFNNWLALESMFMFLLLMQLLKGKSIITVGVVLGAALPLMSSSFRFSSGLILSLVVYDFFANKAMKYWIIGPVGATGYILMAAAPFLVRFSAVSLLLPLLLFVAVSNSPELSERFIGIGQVGYLGGVVGVRTFVVFLSLYYFYFNSTLKWPTKQTGWFRQYMILTIMLLLAANLVLAVANRWMIFVLLVFAIRASSLALKFGPLSFRNSLAASFFFSLLSFPQWIIVIANGGWRD